jgi:uncharacterized protein YbcI
MKMRQPRDVQLERSRGGVLGLQISNAIGRLHKELVGRGPDKVRTFIDDEVVLCLLEGGLTRAERTLQEHAGDEPVVGLRLQLQAAMRSAIVETVQTILGREVRSFMSANDPAHDLQVEILVLAGEDDGPIAADDASGRASRRELLDARRRQALDAARSLREDHAALLAEQAQAYKSLRRRTGPAGER